jgi:hypothetical protein
MLMTVQPFHFEYTVQRSLANDGGKQASKERGRGTSCDRQEMLPIRINEVGQGSVR